MPRVTSPPATTVESEPMREIAVGDVHGRLDALGLLLTQVRDHYRGEETLPILVGDLVDRGPDSAGVVAFVRQECLAGRMHCVLGNHDELFLQVLLLHRADLVHAAGIEPMILEPLVEEYRFAPRQILLHWMRQGGGETIRSYGGSAANPASWEIPPEDVAFLAHLPLAYRSSTMTVTHARGGRRSVAVALAAADRPWTVRDPWRSEILWNREAPDDPLEEIHVSGHTPREAPLRTGSSVEIDTGCVFDGLLTAFDPVDNVYLQVPCPHRPE
jgi:serine/threonine protein phosphatase 1